MSLRDEILNIFIRDDVKTSVFGSNDAENLTDALFKQVPVLTTLDSIDLDLLDKQISTLHNLHSEIVSTTQYSGDPDNQLNDVDGILNFLSLFYAQLEKIRNKD